MACWILSRRDYRTQPGVLTPGKDQKPIRPHKAVIHECLGRIAPAPRVGVAEGAIENPFRVSASLRSLLATPLPPLSGRDLYGVGDPGLKPRAESCSPFGTKSNKPRDQPKQLSYSPVRFVGSEIDLGGLAGGKLGS